MWKLDILLEFNQNAEAEDMQILVNSDVGSLFSKQPISEAVAIINKILNPRLLDTAE